MQEHAMQTPTVRTNAHIVQTHGIFAAAESKSEINIDRHTARNNFKLSAAKLQRRPMVIKYTTTATFSRG